MLTSPKALEEARAHLNCPSLPGVELESGGGTGTAGSHLEDYIFYGDVMCGWIYLTDSSFAPHGHGLAIFSRISLAIMEDMGFYGVNWDRAGALEWGAAAGCTFADSTCDEYSASEADQNHFFGASTTDCTLDRCADACLPPVCGRSRGRSACTSNFCPGKVDQTKFTRPICPACSKSRAFIWSEGLGCYSNHRALYDTYTCATDAATPADSGAPLP